MNVAASCEGWAQLTFRQQKIMHDSLLLSRAHALAQIASPEEIPAHAIAEIKRLHGLWWCHAAVQALEQEEAIDFQKKDIDSETFFGQDEIKETILLRWSDPDYMESRIRERWLDPFPCAGHLRRLIPADEHVPEPWYRHEHSFVLLGRSRMNSELYVWEKNCTDGDFQIVPLSTMLERESDSTEVIFRKFRNTK
ncbi:MAG: hypothetical protein RLZZ342_161 [Candidatus Parcubacteria bacterium]